MRPAMELLPPAIRRAVAKRGPGKKPRKIAVSVRLDPKTLAAYRATGAGWQSLINAHLTQIAASSSPARLKRFRVESGPKLRRGARQSRGIAPSPTRRRA
jgi:hypothetical protein